MSPKQQPRPSGDVTLPAVFRPSLVAALTPATPREVTLPAMTPTLLASPSPARVSLFVLRSPTAAGWMAIAPDPRPSTYGVRSDGPGGFFSISADVWFSLTQYGWYGISQNGEDIIVYDMFRRM